MDDILTFQMIRFELMSKIEGTNFEYKSDSYRNTDGLMPSDTVMSQCARHGWSLAQAVANDA